MADPGLTTRLLNTLLPRRFSPLQRHVARLLTETERHSGEAEWSCSRIEESARRYAGNVREESPGLASAAEARKEAVIGDVHAAHTLFKIGVYQRQSRLHDIAAGLHHDLVKPEDAKRETHASLAKLQEAARTGRRAPMALVYEALREDRLQASRALEGFRKFLHEREGLVDPDPQFRRGEPLVPLTADSRGPAPASAEAPRPRAALRDGTGRTPARTTGRATVQPAARRERRTPGPRHGSGPRT